MSLVATDGHRLALVTVPRESGAGAQTSCASSSRRRRCSSSGRLLGEAGDVVAFEKGENHLFFRSAGACSCRG